MGGNSLSDKQQHFWRFVELDQPVIGTMCPGGSIIWGPKLFTGVGQ
jgi:hypothetical protein